MTTVQTMLACWYRRARRWRALVRWDRGVRLALWFAAMCLAALGAAACAGKKEPKLVPPVALESPYSAAEGDVLWGVAPLANESGTSIADGAAVGDALVARITEVRGISTVPVNRTIAAMRALGMPAVRSVQDARALAAALGVDALVVGTITAYDPYNPPELGLTLALYGLPGALGAEADGWVDPKTLQGSFSDRRGLVRTQFDDRPLSVVSEHLDGSDHGVQVDLRAYAEGRHDPESALGWRRYLASMDLYTDYAAYRSVRRLLEQERLRLGGTGAAEEQPPR